MSQNGSPSSNGGESSVGPGTADIAYNDAMARLSATLQKSSDGRSSGSRSFIHGDEEDYDPSDQLPSIEEARNSAAMTLAKVDFANQSPRSTSSRGMRSFKSPSTVNLTGDESLMAYDDYPEDINVSSGRSKPRHFNIWCVAFCVLLGAVLGTVIGVVLGAEAAMEADLLEGNEFNPSSPSQPQNPPPATIADVSPPTRAPIPPTGPPTSAPTFPLRFDDVAEWLIANDVSGVNSEASQNAAKWIADTDPQHLELPTSASEEGAFIFIQRFVLVLLHFATKGENWSYQFDFLTEHKACHWHRTISSEGDPDQKFQLGAVCNDDDQVQSLNLPNNNLKGSIVTELALLTSLIFLALDHNELTGSIPTELKALTNLDHFTVHWNQLDGLLPTFIGDFDKLNILGMGNNKFRGKIPTRWFRLPNLQTLGLDDNLLTGSFTGIEDMGSLERVYLEQNQFTQSMQDMEWDNLPSLVELDLSANIVTGTLPSALFGHARLEILDLSDNSLDGLLPSIPAPVGEQYPLKYLGLHNNGFTGPIHNSFQHLSDLTHLDVSNNKLTSDIPNHLGFLSHMVYFFMANNNFDQAEIPDIVRGFPKIQDLSFKNTNRKGPIPEYLVELKHLVLLDLDNNKLEGTIPKKLHELTNLEYLFLNRNEGLTGTIPTEIQSMPSLNMFLVDGTSFSGDLNALCERSTKLEISGADCEEVTCDCCQICCSDGNTTGTCKDRVYFGQLDATYENSYNRKSYQFGLEGRRAHV